MATLLGHTKPVQSLWSARGRLYSTAGRYLRVWDVTAPSFPCVRVLQLPRDGGALGALALDAAGALYVAGQVIWRLMIFIGYSAASQCIWTCYFSLPSTFCSRGSRLPKYCKYRLCTITGFAGALLPP